MKTAQAPPGRTAELLASIGRAFRRAMPRRSRVLQLDLPRDTASQLAANFPDLRRKVEGLAKRAWPGAPIGTSIIEPHEIPPSASFEVFVSKLLHHARHTTELSTPWRTPKISVENTGAYVGGRFVVDEGWVKIVVGKQFFRDVSAARSVLCHEVCHYILDMSEIGDRTREENERLTDVAMFVFGFGKIFKAGYKRASFDNRHGHRLGYLSDAEYSFVEGYVDLLLRRQPR